MFISNKLSIEIRSLILHQIPKKILFFTFFLWIISISNLKKLLFLFSQKINFYTSFHFLYDYHFGSTVFQRLFQFFFCETKNNLIKTWPFEAKTCYQNFKPIHKVFDILIHLLVMRYIFLVFFSLFQVENHFSSPWEITVMILFDFIFFLF